jgi:AcrR family transcriptional regulator
MNGNSRAELLETARSLNCGGTDQLSIAALCKSTGLSRSVVRRHFPTNGALNAALKKDESAKARSPQPEPEVSGAREDWMERRLRVFERALSLLETKTEETARQQSQAITSLEEKIAAPAAVPLPAIELPPIAAKPAPMPEIPAQTAPADPSPASLAIPKWEIPKPRLDFDAREKLESILERAQSSPGDAPTPKPFERTRALPWVLIVAGILLAALVLSAILNRTGSPAASKPVTVARTQTRQTSGIVVIDATGAPATPSQTTSASVRTIIARAEGGEANAQTEAALAFLRGDGVDADPLAAARWSQAAAAQGEANAQFMLGSLYAEGIKPDPQRAVQWYAAAAARGNAKAMHNLAIAYLNGQGVAKDPAAAIGWLTRAARSGYRDSAFDLAVLYERGEGVAQSPQEALQWYDAAASRGDLQAAERAKFLRSQLPQMARNVRARD